LYAKVVSAHIWGECFESNPLCRHAGELYRQELLKYGGGKDPNEILRDLLDVDESPDIEALVDSYIGLRKGDHLDL
jgi:intermediate peptidase